MNSGTAIVGNIGSDSRMEYTAIGACVNLAARFEAVARPQQILCGLEVKARAPEFEFDELGKHKLAAGDEHEVFTLVL